MKAKALVALAEHTRLDKPAASGEPISATTFEAAMARFPPFEDRPDVGVAVSGGPDSMAALLLTIGWVRDRGGRAVALIVNHGLRAGSTEEANSVAERCRSLGAKAHILHWEHDGIASRVQERAREARYRLLTQACRQAGLLHLLTGHTADDQAETVALRTERGSGPHGRAGMAPLVYAGDVRVLRPLLTFSRSRTVATVKAAGVTAVADPSNKAVHFARARLRRNWAEEPGGEVKAAAAIDQARVFAPQRQQAERDVADLGMRTVRILPLGAALVDLVCLRNNPPETCRRLIAAVIRSISGAGYPVSIEPGSALADWLARALCAARPLTGITFGGCFLKLAPKHLAKRPAVLVMRDPGALAAARPRLQHGQWDGRFRFTWSRQDRQGGEEGAGDWPQPDLPNGLSIAPPNQAIWQSLRRQTGLKTAVWPSPMRGALPAVWSGAGEEAFCAAVFWPCSERPHLLRPVSGAPFLGSLAEIAGLVAAFRPVMPLAPASFAVV